MHRRLRPGIRGLYSDPKHLKIEAVCVREDRTGVDRRWLENLDQAGFDHIWKDWHSDLSLGVRAFWSEPKCPEVLAARVKEDGSLGQYWWADLGKAGFDRMWNDEPLEAGQNIGEESAVATNSVTYVSIFGDGLEKVGEAEKGSTG